MPKGIYDEISCTNDKHPKFNPTKHQIATVKAFLKSKFKGMLLYHKLGSGKTCTSILIADQLLKKKKIKKVYVLTPGSLRSGWINEYCGVCGKNPDYLYKKYVFITYNYMVGRNLPNFDGSLVIIDEIHNLINGAKNQSFHPTQIYNALNEAKCRILALSGTPIYNYIYEFALLGNLLKPGYFPEIRKGPEKIDEIEFMRLFTENSDGTLRAKNPTKVRRLLDGIVSYYPGAGKEFVPELEEQPIIKVQMTREQEERYWVQKEQELRLSKPPSERLKYEDREKYNLLSRLYIMANKYVLTRMVSNFCYPEDEDIKKFEQNEAKFRDIRYPEGWIDHRKFKYGQLVQKYSPKFSAFFLNLIAHHKQKHVLFTFFKERSGVILINTLLSMCGIKSAIFSGDLNDSKRKSVLKRFNSEKNIHGDVIRVLLVTEAGAEGISVLEARHMHILESSPRMTKTVQAIGRVARYKSHQRLPLAERNIKVWRYWSIASPEPLKIITKVLNSDGSEEYTEKLIVDKECVDEMLYNKGMKTIRGIYSFLELLKSVSVTPYSE